MSRRRRLHGFEHHALGIAAAALQRMVLTHGRADDLVESVGNSPVKMLGAASQALLHRLEVDEGFLSHMDRVEEALNDYLASNACWFH